MGSQEKVSMTDVMAESKVGMKLWKILGVITLISLVVAVGRIVLRVFREEDKRRSDASESQSGV